MTLDGPEKYGEDIQTARNMARLGERNNNRIHTRIPNDSVVHTAMSL